MKIDYTNLDTYIQRTLDAAKPFQKLCIEHLIKYCRTIIAARGGTGKTMMALTAAFSQRPEKILICCSRNALYTWQKEIKKWYPEFYQPGMYNVINGKFTKDKRAKLWAKDALFYVCTYKTLMSDVNMPAFAKHQWDVLIADEYHRGGLRNKKTKGYELFKALRNIPAIFPMSGSNARKGPQDFWALLNILDGKLFNSYWKFVRTFCVMNEGPFGWEILGPQNMEGFAQMTHRNLYRIPKSISDAELPKITRQIVPIDMSPKQEKAYKELAKQMYTEAEEGKLVVASTILAQYVKLRQLLACPRILGIDDPGTALEIVADAIEDREEIRSVIFTPFRPSVEAIKKHMQDRFQISRVWSLWGGDEPETVKQVTEDFRAKGGIVVVSVSFAESFELETADNCHFIGYDWDQNVNEQCEWRLQRLTSDINKPIIAYYYQYRKTIDEEILEVLNTNTRNVKNTFLTADKLKELILKTSLQPKDAED